MHGHVNRTYGFVRRCCGDLWRSKVLDKYVMLFMYLHWLAWCWKRILIWSRVSDLGGDSLWTGRWQSVKGSVTVNMAATDSEHVGNLQWTWRGHSVKRMVTVSDLSGDSERGGDSQWLERWRSVNGAVAVSDLSDNIERGGDNQCTGR